MTGPLRVGDIVHGYLCGLFGRDHYDCARVEAIGADWAVLRSLDTEQPITGSGRAIVAELEKARDPAVVDEHTYGCPER